MTESLNYQEDRGVPNDEQLENLKAEEKYLFLMIFGDIRGKISMF